MYNHLLFSVFSHISPLGFTESYLICIKNIHSDLIHEGFRKKQHATLHTVRGHVGLYLLKQH